MNKRTKTSSQKFKKQPLEENIMASVYQYESKRTGIMLLRYLLIFAGLIILMLILENAILDILHDQETLDLLQLFTEDVDIIRTYFWQVAYIFFIESPKLLILLFSLCALLFTSALVVFLKNFSIMKKRIQTLLKHFRK